MIRLLAWTAFLYHASAYIVWGLSLAIFNTTGLDTSWMAE